MWSPDRSLVTSIVRYTYGIFEQKIVGGRQVEHPDYWLVMDNPWEICRHDIAYAVRFYG